MAISINAHLLDLCNISGLNNDMFVYPITYVIYTGLQRPVHGNTQVCIF